MFALSEIPLLFFNGTSVRHMVLLRKVTMQEITQFLHLILKLAVTLEIISNHAISQ